MAESQPYQYVTSTGVIIPDTAGLYSDVQTEYKGVFGADLVVTPDTPQGILITAETLARVAEVNNNAAVANQLNPNIATGVFLDAISALSGQQRTVQTRTLVTNVTLAGVAGTNIPEGSQAQTAAGDIFSTASAVTLNGAGTAQVNFYSQAYGPIPCAASALNQVVSNVLGWETVLNDSSSTPAAVTTLGKATQSDQQFRALRQNTLAFQGVSLAAAIMSALYNVEDVTSLTFQENTAATTEVINGISMVAHSIYACVAGGTDLNVAAALLENKSSGCAWNGSTTINVIEPASGQTYEVKFDRPTEKGILIKVFTPNGNAANISQAILDYAAGILQVTDQTGATGTLPGFVVGASISPWDIAAAIVAENPGVYISNIQISLLAPVNYASTPIPIGINEQAYTQASFITVVVG